MDDEGNPFLLDSIPDEQRQPDVPDEYYDAVLRLRRETYRAQHPWPEEEQFARFEAWCESSLSPCWWQAIHYRLAEEDRQWSTQAPYDRKLELVAPLWNERFARICRTVDAIFPDLPDHLAEDDELDDFPYLPVYVAASGEGVGLYTEDTLTPAQFAGLYWAGIETSVNVAKKWRGYDEDNGDYFPTSYLCVHLSWRAGNDG